MYHDVFDHASDGMKKCAEPKPEGEGGSRTVTSSLNRATYNLPAYPGHVPGHKGICGPATRQRARHCYPQRLICSRRIVSTFWYIIEPAAAVVVRGLIT